MSYLSLSNDYVVVTCGCGCDLQFAMTRIFYNHTKESGCTWYCPKGHARSWSGPTTTQKLEAAEARQRALKDQLEAAEAEAEATRVKLIRDRHRFANGVCPCCNRSFENVARHMKTKHPDFDPAELGRPETLYKCSCGRTFGTPHGLKIHQSRNRSDNWTDPNAWKWGRHLTVTGR